MPNTPQDTSDRTLWGVGTSRTLRAHWALIELGLDYETIAIRPRTPAMDGADLLRVSPDKKVPVLQDGALTIAESPAIVLYLGERYQTEAHPLVPPSVTARAQLFEWVSYISMELDATSLYVLRRHLDLAATYGEAPTAVAAARDYFVRMIDRTSRNFADGRPYLLGDAFSAADILLVSCFGMADKYEAALPDDLGAYRDRVHARPAYQQAMKANNP